MNVVVIPFFLAAHLSTDETWAHGPEYTFQVQVNCTAIPEEGIYGSVRLNLESKLICQPLKSGHSLSCHFEDSKANSFVTDSLDPSELAMPTGQVNRQPAYEINEDQFEIKFNKRGLDDLVVNENIQPRELDMIRLIVGQLSVGAILEGIGNDVIFDAMENFTQGECYTTFKIDKKLVDRSLYGKPNYALRPVFGLRDGKLMQIRKIRNLYMCAHKVPYFFGSADSFQEESDIISDASLSNGHIIITSTEFISDTSNVITRSKINEEVVTTLYENVRLRLESIQPAESEPPSVKEAESASIFIGRWLIDNSSEEDN
ncbi:vitellogenin-1 isoform X2 [Polyergus mexicanus]|uniref:vitellogenin-1 isoform X2 n=1 Tax=Polyergus mexicanus TaxID=615972 RepID=UPI0038B5E5BC